MKDYRKFWKRVNGDIPQDENGISYDIHHKDGNRNNNELSNLMCVSIKEHYEIHYNKYLETGSYKELASARMLAGRLINSVDELTGYTLTEETKEKIRNTLKGRSHSEERRKAIAMGRKKGKSCNKLEHIEARSRGLKQYYKDATEEELRERWDKISKAHKGKKLKKSTKEKLSRHNSKHSDEVVLEIDKMIKDGVRYKVISEKYDISPAQISQIKQRKTYKWLFEDVER